MARAMGASAPILLSPRADATSRRRLTPFNAPGLVLSCRGGG